MKRRWNLHIWAGFLVSLAAFLSYFLFFYLYPVTRDIPWVNYLLFALAGYLFWSGLRRAFREPQLYRGKIIGPVLGALSLLICGFFLTYTLYLSKQLPASKAVPQVGQRAPDFTLANTEGRAVTLAELLRPQANAPGAQKVSAVLLIFYRGYW